MFKFRLFESPKNQWINILDKSYKDQVKFFNKVCYVNRKDMLVIRGVFFDNLGFSLVKKIFKLAKKIIDDDKIDYSFQDLIFDRLLGVSEIAHLYPDHREEKTQIDDNLIFGEGYHVYSASYEDLDLLVDFLTKHEEIKSLCDLGSGSGRALFYIALKMDRVLNYMGLELVEARVEFTKTIAQNFDLQNMSFRTSNFLETPKDLEGYGAYYLYDPVGADDVDELVSHFEKMIINGDKFYILFISGWDDNMLDALNELESLEKIASYSSQKQDDRYVNFYKVK